MSRFRLRKSWLLTSAALELALCGALSSKHGGTVSITIHVPPHPHRSEVLSVCLNKSRHL